MIIDSIYLRRYDWHITILYEVTYGDRDEVLYHLHNIHPKRGIIERVKNLMSCDNVNFGFTATCGVCKNSLIVLGKTTSRSEFMNTLEHEIRHVVDDISEAYDIPPKGEEVGYITGEINYRLTHRTQDFICDCS